MTPRVWLCLFRWHHVSVLLICHPSLSIILHIVRSDTSLMSSYLRNWFSSGGASANNNLPTVVPSIPEIISVSPPPSEHDSGDEDDQPPAFPALSSIQRSGGNSTSRSPVTLPNRSPDFDSKMMPPPSLPIGLNRNISSSNSLSLPTSTTKPMPKVNTKGKARQNVALTPGHGPLDWAKLKTSGVDLRVRVS